MNLVDILVNTTKKHEMKLERPKYIPTQHSIKRSWASLATRTSGGSISLMILVIVAEKVVVVIYELNEMIISMKSNQIFFYQETFRTSYCKQNICTTLAAISNLDFMWSYFSTIEIYNKSFTKEVVI